MNFFPGIIYFILMNGLLLAAAFLFAARISESEKTIEKLLTAFVVFFAQIVAVTAILGFAGLVEIKYFMLGALFSAVAIVLVSSKFKKPDSAKIADIAGGEQKDSFNFFTGFFFSSRRYLSA